jgi:hypothetical protein
MPPGCTNLLHAVTSIATIERTTLEYKDRLTYSLCIFCSPLRYFFCFINKLPLLSDPLTSKPTHFNIPNNHSYFGLIIALCSWIFPAEMLIWVCFSSTCYTTATVTRFVFYIFTYYIRKYSGNAVQGFYCYCCSNAGIMCSNSASGKNMCVCVWISVAP